MASQAFPMSRILMMIFYQVSYPIVFKLRNHAARSNTFRNYICIPFARVYNRVSSRFKAWEDGTLYQYEELDDEKAIRLGTTILGEGMCLTFSLTVMILEYLRHKKKEQIKMVKESTEMKLSQSIVRNLYFLSEKRAVLIRSLNRDIKLLNEECDNLLRVTGNIWSSSKLKEREKMAYAKKATVLKTSGVFTRALEYLQEEVI